MSNLVLVYNWAPWCQPCKALTPIIDKLAQTRTDIKVTKVNVDNSNEWIPNMPSLKAVPTLWLLKDGELVWQASGAVSPYAIDKGIDEHK